MSREKILQQVQQNQPSLTPLPTIDIMVHMDETAMLDQFLSKLGSLHVAAFLANGFDEVKTIIHKQTDGGRFVTTISEFRDIATLIETVNQDAHSLEDVQLAIIPAHFGVAENGAVWVTEDLVKYRVLPFIAQQLAVVIKRGNIVANMHQAYEIIADTSYDFAAFIAGPSKTADIEQSLVLGAHGPKGMMLFVVDED